MFIFSKIKEWVGVIIAVIVAFGSAYILALLKGRSEGKSEAREEDAEATLQATKNDLNLRQTIDAKVNSLPLPKVTVPPPVGPQEPFNAQSVITADPSSAAGELRDWMPKG
jgi:hypothetical protein